MEKIFNYKWLGNKLHVPKIWWEYIVISCPLLNQAIDKLETPTSWFI